MGVEGLDGSPGPDVNTSIVPVASYSTACVSSVLIVFLIYNKCNVWTHFLFLQSLGAWPWLYTKNCFCLPLGLPYIN